MRVIELHKSSSWTKAFEDEAMLLKRTLGSLLLEIHHIGSTAIPDILAKRVIDIILVVENITALDLVSDKFEAIGYEPMGEYGISGRRFYKKGGEQRTHHIHAFESCSNEIIRHLAFRDFLRSHRHKAEKYEQLKITLAAKYRYSSKDYSKGKSKLIQQLEREALEWLAVNK